jgi:hypothetical protein
MKKDELAIMEWERSAELEKGEGRIVYEEVALVEVRQRQRQTASTWDYIRACF